LARSRRLFLGEQRQRAKDWAEFLTKHPPEPDKKISNPFVVGAVIDLGNCLDLTDAGSLDIIRAGYEEFRRTIEQAGATLPENESAGRGDNDLVRRHLDCAVVNFVHLLREREINPFDTVRGIFTEGDELYPGARIMAKTHVQVCVRNPKKSIKGYFRPPRLITDSGATAQSTRSTKR
jgi:hypothetical protein